MKSGGHFLGNPFALASVFLAAMFLVACEQSKQAAPAPAAAAPQTTSMEKVFVQFQGPWAFAVDPKDANSVLAIAPKAKGHRELFVQASNQSSLAAGVYDLSVPAHSTPGAVSTDPSIAQAKIDAQSLQRALGAKSGRYVIRLPKPEAYVTAGRSRSRVGTSYPPDASTEKDYATAVSVRYSVSSMNGFSLAGTPDSGTFNPFLLQVETPVIRFVIEPAQDDNPADQCDTRSRESFHHLTKLLGLTLYVDFPDNPSDCHKNDPQSANPKAAAVGILPLDGLRMVLGGEVGQDAQMASLAGGGTSLALAGLLGGGDDTTNFRQSLVAVAYFFSLPARDCHAPILMLTTTP
ncbi:MAG TPA: hypothetical protein VF845_02335 [Terriglobales bacterium]